MSDEVWIKITGAIEGHIQGITDPRKTADQIIAIFREEGYMHPDDLVEGVKICHAGEGFPCAYKLNNGICNNEETCGHELPATLQEVILAVKG